jgi:hypothetical protein
MQIFFEENNHFLKKKKKIVPPKHPKIQKFEKNNMNVVKKMSKKTSL